MLADTLHPSIYSGGGPLLHQRILSILLAGVLISVFSAALGGSNRVLADTTPPAGAVTMHGVDLYHGDSENGQVDWQAFARTQDFAYIKTDEGENFVDPMFKENYLHAEAYSVAWGPYHFLRLYSEVSARRQADNYWNRIRGTGWTVLPAVDCESHDGQQTAAGMRACIRAFITEFERVAGFKPVLYTYTSYANEFLRGYFSDCLLWVADYRGYVGALQGWTVWQAWQYTDRGSIPAVANNEVDLNKATNGILAVPLTPEKPHSAYPYIVPVRRGDATQRTVRVSPSWSASVIGTIRPGERYEIWSAVDKNGWVRIGLGGKPIGWVSAFCF